MAFMRYTSLLHTLISKSSFQFFATCGVEVSFHSFCTLSILSSVKMEILCVLQQACEQIIMVPFYTYSQGHCNNISPSGAEFYKSNSQSVSTTLKKKGDDLSSFQMMKHANINQCSSVPQAQLPCCVLSSSMQKM